MIFYLIQFGAHFLHFSITCLLASVSTSHSSLIAGVALTLSKFWKKKEFSQQAGVIVIRINFTKSGCKHYINGLRQITRVDKVGDSNRNYEYYLTCISLLEGNMLSKYRTGMRSGSVFM